MIGSSGSAKMTSWESGAIIERYSSQLFVLEALVQRQTSMDRAAAFTCSLSLVLVEVLTIAVS